MNELVRLIADDDSDLKDDHDVWQPRGPYKRAWSRCAVHTGILRRGRIQLRVRNQNGVSRRDHLPGVLAQDQGDEGGEAVKLNSITFRPVAWVHFSLAEIGLLMQCSASHYDSVCRQASKVGGFLYGMNNRATHDAMALHSLTFRELDTLAKINEAGAYMGNPDRQVCHALEVQLHNALRTLNERMPEQIDLDTVES